MKGFTLVEVLVAMALVAMAAAALMELVNLSGASVRDARADTIETFAAASKLAELRAQPALVPGGSLNASLTGYADFLTSDGALAGVTSGTTPATAVYQRRWSIAPAPLDPGGTVVLEVTTTRVGRPTAREVDLVALVTRAFR